MVFPLYEQAGVVSTSNFLQMPKQWFEIKLSQNSIQSSHIIKKDINFEKNSVSEYQEHVI